MESGGNDVEKQKKIYLSRCESARLGYNVGAVGSVSRCAAH